MGKVQQEGHRKIKEGTKKVTYFPKYSLAQRKDLGSNSIFALPFRPKRLNSKIGIMIPTL